MTKKSHAGIQNRVVLRFDEHGRLQIPAELRKAAGMSDAGSVLVWLEQGHLHVVAAEVAAREAQQIARRYLRPGESLAASLIADRREEARREDADE